MPFHNPVKAKLRNGETTIGCWLNGCSAMTAEVVGLSGIEWTMIDMEHGPGDYMTLVSQLQALRAYSTIPLTRIPLNDTIYIKKVLDAGSYGVMIPLVNSAAEAQKAVAAAKYPPDGDRGCAMGVRAYGFGKHFQDYIHTMNAELMVIMDWFRDKLKADVADVIPGDYRGGTEGGLGYFLVRYRTNYESFSRALLSQQLEPDAPFLLDGQDANRQVIRLVAKAN